MEANPTSVPPQPRPGRGNPEPEFKTVKPQDVDLSTIYIRAPDVDGIIGSHSLLDLYEMGLPIEVYRWFLGNLVRNIIGLQQGQVIEIPHMQRMVAFLENLGFTIIKAKKDDTQKPSEQAQSPEAGAPAEEASHESQDVQKGSGEAEEEGNATPGAETSGQNQEAQKPDSEGVTSPDGQDPR